MRHTSRRRSEPDPLAPIPGACLAGRARPVPGCVGSDATRAVRGLTCNPQRSPPGAHCRRLENGRDRPALRVLFLRKGRDSCDGWNRAARPGETESRASLNADSTAARGPEHQSSYRRKIFIPHAHKDGPMLDWISLFLGALLGWMISHIYYLRARSDQRNELRDLKAALTKAIEDGMLEVTRNSSGKIMSIRRPSAPTNFRID
jgi:hypothetical protein